MRAWHQGRWLLIVRGGAADTRGQLMGWKRKMTGGVVAMIGFMLSPLSWWNDLFVNVPLALAFAWLVSWFYKPAFTTALVVETKNDGRSGGNDRVHAFAALLVERPVRQRAARAGLCVARSEEHTSELQS